jgi:hypothetical protein
VSERIPTPEEQRLEQLHQRVDRDFSYHAPREGQPEKYSALRAKARELAHLVVELVPSGREQASALTKLEESVMHANAGIARAPA